MLGKNIQIYIPLNLIFIPNLIKKNEPQLNVTVYKNQSKLTIFDHIKQKFL